MNNIRLKRFVIAVTHVMLLQVLVGTVQAGILINTNSPAVWSAQVTGVQTEPFENVPTGFAQYPSPPGLTRSSINYSIDRSIDTGGRMLEVSPGNYAPTAVLSMQDTPNGQFSNVLITPATPIDAFAVRHAVWRGTQVQFTATYTDSSTEVFLANTVFVNASVVSGATPMTYTGVTSDMLISSILIETTQTANDQFARGLNIDNFAIGDAIPEPTGACLFATVSLLIFGGRMQRTSVLNTVK
jgi:hypothetical protein